MTGGRRTGRSLAAALLLSWGVVAAACAERTAPATSAATPATSASTPATAGTAVPAGAAVPGVTSTTTVASPPADSGEITLAFGGDVHFEGPLRAQLVRHPEQVLAAVRPILSSADLAVVNLETAIGTGGDKAAKAFNFLAPPAAFDALSGAGVDVMSMANNHGLDYGQSGLRQTLAAIDARHAPVIGVGVDEAAAYHPFTATVRGQRIAVIGATQILDGNLIADWTARPDRAGVASAKRVDRLVQAVRDARAAAEVVVVFLHWGTETQQCPNAAQLALAPRLVDAGADVVVGGHAHRVLGGGYLGRAFVDYGLGNFQFVSSSSPARESGVLRLTLRGRSVVRVEWLPARIGADAQPVPLAGAAAEAARQRWRSLRSCTKLTDVPTETP